MDGAIRIVRAQRAAHGCSFEVVDVIAERFFASVVDASNLQRRTKQPDLQTGLLFGLTHGRLFRRLAWLDRTARHGPRWRFTWIGLQHHEQGAVVRVPAQDGHALPVRWVAGAVEASIKTVAALSLT